MTVNSFLKSLMPDKTLYKGEAIYIGNDSKRDNGDENVWLYHGKHYPIRAVQNQVTLNVTVEVMDSAYSHVRTTLHYTTGNVSKEWSWGEPSPSRRASRPARENKVSVGIPQLRPVAA